MEKSKKNTKRSQQRDNLLGHEFGKVPPQNVDFEEIVLGTIMDYTINDDIYSIIFPEMFYKDSSIRICKAILELHERSEPINSSTVANELKNTRELEVVGGPYMLLLMVGKALPPVNIEYYIRIIQESWLKRSAIRISQDATALAYEDQSDCFDIVTDMQTELDNSLGKVLIGTAVSVVDTVKYNLKKISEAMMSKVENFYKTGMDNLDSLLKLTGNNIILIAAKNGSGKTKFIINYMSRLFTRYPNKIGVLWYSMEDGDDKIVRNFIAQRIKLSDEEQLSKGYKLTMEQLDLITSISNEIGKYNIEFVNEKSSIKDIGKHYKKFRSQNRQNDLNVLIIDNIMLLEENVMYRNQTAADDAISAEIDSWNVKTGRDTDPLVILVHHLTDEQLDKSALKEAYRPREKHIKGSSRYRDLVTIIMMLNRPSQYADLVNAYRGKIDVLKDVFLLDITKNRNGKTGLVRFFANFAYNIFEEF